MRKARIIGMGSYLPERVLTNLDLERLVETTDEWIFSRTGIRERRIAASNESTSDLAAHAGRRAIEASGIPMDEIELIIVATTTPDFVMPGTAALVQSKIGLKGAAAFDIQAACAGYINGLSIAKAYIESGMYRNILLIAGDKMSSVIDYQERTTCVLFGDAAAAAVISDTGPGFSIDGITLGTDGSLSHLIVIPAGGSDRPASIETVGERLHYIKMEGKEVFRHAVRYMTAAVKECLVQTGLKEEQITWLIPHQANERIIDAISKNFKIPSENIGKTLCKYGNTSASSVAITLEEFNVANLIKVEEKILLVAFGSGLTWGTAILTKKGI